MTPWSFRDQRRQPIDHTYRSGYDQSPTNPDKPVERNQGDVEVDLHDWETSEDIISYAVVTADETCSQRSTRQAA